MENRSKEIENGNGNRNGSGIRSENQSERGN